MNLAFMPFYLGDYLAETAHLSLAEHGAYLHLTLNYWQRRGPLPDDDRKLAGIARMTAAEWAQSRDVLRDLFEVGADGWRKPALDELLANAAKRYADARVAGQASAAKRRGETVARLQADAIKAAERASVNDGSTPVERPLNEGSTIREDKRRGDNRKKEDSSLRSESLLSDPVGSDPQGGDHRKSEAEAKPKRATRGTGADYPGDFERFWRDYPTDRNMSKSQAAKAWAKLSPQDRLAAGAAVPGFVAYCQESEGYRPVHAERFLSQRRFDGYAPDAKPPTEFRRVSPRRQSERAPPVTIADVMRAEAEDNQRPSLDFSPTSDGWGLA